MQFKNIIQDLQEWNFVCIHTPNCVRYLFEKWEELIFPRKPRHNKKYSSKWTIKGFAVICLEKNPDWTDDKVCSNVLIYFFYLPIIYLEIKKIPCYYFFSNTEINFVWLFGLNSNLTKPRANAVGKRHFTFFFASGATLNSSLNKYSRVK